MNRQIMNLLFERNILPYVINARALRRWWARRSAVRVGAGTVAQIGIFGDSISEGYQCEASLTLAGVQSKSWVGKLHQYYKARFGDCEWGWQWPGLSSGETYGTMSPDAVFLRSNDNRQAFGGHGFWIPDANLAVANPTLNFTFNGTGVDVILEQCEYGASGTGVDIQIDGTPVETGIQLRLTAPADNVVLKKTYTGLADGAHTVSIIRRQVNTYCAVDGIRPICGTNGVQFLNFSWSGARSTQLAAVSKAADMAAKSIQMFPLDLVLFGWHSNDRGVAGGAGTGVANYKTNLKNYIALALANGSDVALVTSCTGPASTVQNSAGETYRSYYDAMKEVAVETGVCLIDLWKYWADKGYTQTYINTLLSDGTHPTESGHDVLFYRPILAALEN